MRDRYFVPDARRQRKILLKLATELNDGPGSTYLDDRDELLQHIVCTILRDARLKASHARLRRGSCDKRGGEKGAQHFGRAANFSVSSA